MMKQAQPTLRKPPRRDQGSNDLDPAKLSVTLRELALRAHQLVRAIDGSSSSADDPEQELTEVHAQIVRLQRTLLAPTGRPGHLRLRPQERVEERLA